VRSIWLQRSHYSLLLRCYLSSKREHLPAMRVAATKLLTFSLLKTDADY